MFVIFTGHSAMGLPPLPTIANTRAETSMIVSDRELIWCLLEPWKHNAVHLHPSFRFRYHVSVASLREWIAL